jgi:hypothetical protein
MDEVKSFLGTGWSFPPVFNKTDHSVSMVSEIDDIEAYKRHKMCKTCELDNWSKLYNNKEKE